MKNNFNGDTQKKLILSSLLVAALAGPSMFQISSKTSGSVEMAQMAAPAAASDTALTTPPSADQLKELQAKLKSISGEKDAAIKDKEAATKERDALRAKVTEQETRLTKLETEANQRKAADEERERKEREAAAEREREAKRKTEAQAKKKIEDQDCEKKEKAIERTECRKAQKEEAAEVARESLQNDFEESLNVAKEICETRASRKSDLDQDVLVASCMAGKMGSVLRQYKNKKVNGIRVQLDKNTIITAYREHIGATLNQLLYSDDAESELKAQGILQSIMSAQIPSQYADIKRQAMLDVRTATNKELTEVVAEYRKMNSPEMRNNKELRDQQEQLANAKRSQMHSQLENYGSIVGHAVNLTSASDMTALQYFKSTFEPDMRKILNGLWGIKPNAVAEGESTRGARGTVEAGVARDSVNRGVVQTGDDQKMRRTGTQGLKHEFERTESTDNFGAGALRSSATGTRTGRVQVGTAK